MNEKKILLWILAFCLFIPICFATDGCVISEDCTWYATGASWATGANFTLTYANGTSTTEAEATDIGGGKFVYTNQINTTGNVLGCIKVYNSTISSTMCESKEIRGGVVVTSTEFNSFTLIVGIGFFIAILLYFAFKLDSKKDFLFQLLLFFIVLSMFVLMGNAILATGISGGIIFYRTTLFLFWIFNIYVFIRFIYNVLLFLKILVPKK